MSRSQSSPKNQPRADFSAPDLQDGRYGRFGLWAGLGVALAVHLVFFALPKPGTFEESAQDTERGIVARTYRQRAFIPGQGNGAQAEEAPRPAAPTGPRPAPRTGDRPGAQAFSVEEAGARSAPTSTSEQNGQAGGAWGDTAGGSDLSSGSSGTADSGVEPQNQGMTTPPVVTARIRPTEEMEAGTARTAPKAESSAQEWEKMLAALSQKGTEQKARPSSSAQEPVREARLETRQKTTQAAPPVEAEDEALDKRIRITVVSYPPTSVEKKFPPIPYPQVAVARSRLEAGICRVYYRVWVNSSGEIERDEVKSPSSSEELKKYEPFVQAVRDSVAQWQFDQVKAQVHIDVLFEIK